MVLVLPILFKSIANNPVHLYNKLYLLVSVVDPQGEWCEVLLCHRQMSPFIQGE